ncbi:hypothetical protein [Pontibacter akesuensis]|uniref:Lipoprotein n=1 Tax=Pontibacter akesuensis TaxID=388950 RepID=A0A1I7FLB0_9BACT|nr:hypothetical protein [Pontibacter akesuensis]SFU36928.1 hypothetical protein SAMN04487941_0292 [Pontibacter akesuensis]
MKKHTTWATAILCSLVFSSACNQEAPSTTPTAKAEAPAVAQPDSTPVAAAPPDTAGAIVSPDTTAAPEYPGPAPLAGAILPGKRIVAYYGNPLSKRMGILGELPVDQMLARLDEEVANWNKVDPNLPVQPALHAIVVTAQGHPSAGGKYRLRMTDKMIDDVLAMAKKRDAIVFLDVQVGHSTLQEELPALEKYLLLPHVHLGIDAEFSMKNGSVPGRKIGTFDAKDIDYATGYLASLVKEHQLPPKLLIVHRFTQGMITNSENITLRPEVQVVMHMDGWGPPALKKDTYRRYIKNEPVQFTGFKVFYKNDLKNNSRLMTPEEIAALTPSPLYIQYQ